MLTSANCIHVGKGICALAGWLASSPSWIEEHWSATHSHPTQNHVYFSVFVPVFSRVLQSHIVLICLFPPPLENVVYTFIICYIVMKMESSPAVLFALRRFTPCVVFVFIKPNCSTSVWKRPHRVLSPVFFSCSDHSNLKRMEFVNNASFMVFIVFFNGL